MTDSETSERAVADLIDGFFDAMDDRELEEVRRLLARDPDVVHVGTEADERWVGWEELEAATREQFAALRSFRVSPRERRVKLLGSGEAACFSQVMDLRTESEGGSTTLEGARLTGVAERRERGWVLVQTHLSVPDDSAGTSGRGDETPTGAASVTAGSGNAATNSGREPAGLRRLVEHLAWANRRALASARDAGDEEARRLIAHVLGAERVWLARLETGGSSGLEIWPDLGLGACDELLAENAKALRRYVEERGGAKLRAPVAYRNSKGRAFETPARDILLHLCLHGEHHRGQIARRVREAGLEPVNSDYITFVRRE